MYQILGLYRFPFGQEILYRPTYKWIEENTLKLRQVDFYKCIKFEFLSEFNWIERISFIKICLGWLLGIYCKDNLRAVLRVEICNGRSLLLLLDICTNVALISDSWKGTVRGGWGVGAKESRTAQKKQQPPPFLNIHTSFGKITKILRFQPVSSWFLYFHENFRKHLFFEYIDKYLRYGNP